MTTEPRIAAVIVTYNRHELLVQSIEALLAQTSPIDTIFVIDNASTDETPMLFDEGNQFFRPNITYVRLPQNKGGAGGFKEGMRQARDGHYDWCWVMDDDVIAQPDALEKLLDALNYLEGAGVEPSFLASHVSGPGGEVMNVPNVSNHLSDNGYPDWCEHLTHSLVRIASATFVSLLISVQAINRVGLPIADYFLWGDDGEYTARLTSYYGPAFVVGQSRVTHLRTAARAISTAEETDAARVANRRRAIRNDLINTSYYEGPAKTARRLARRARECLTIVTGPYTLKRTKVAAIGGGIVDFFAHRYNLEDLTKLDKRTMGRY